MISRSTFKYFLILWVIPFFYHHSQAQTIEELKAEKAEKEAEAAEIASEIATLKKQIDSIPGWRTGAFGTIGFNLTDFSNWVSKANPNSTSTTILGSMNGFANLIEEKYFWRNSGNLAFGWQKLVIDKNDPDTDDAKFEQTTDVISLSSLYGHNLTDNLAMSALGEFRSSILNNFSNPGYLDLGVGFTWTPVNPLVVVVHPVNYNIVFAKDETAFKSSLGSKVLIDYKQNILQKFNLKSNLSAFLSYKDISELSNYTWTNGIAFTAFKGIGVGIEFALRKNKQETTAYGTDKHGQNYWVIGLTYNL